MIPYLPSEVLQRVSLCAYGFIRDVKKYQHCVIRLYVRSGTYSWVRRFILVRSAIAGLRACRRGHAIVVIGGVDAVSRLRVILHLPCIPQIVRGRLR